MTVVVIAHRGRRLMIDRRDHTPINAGWKQSVKFTLQSLYAVMHDHLVVVPQKEHLGMLIYRSSGSIPSTPTEWNPIPQLVLSPLYQRFKAFRQLSVCKTDCLELVFLKVQGQFSPLLRKTRRTYRQHRTARCIGIVGQSDYISLSAARALQRSQPDSFV